MGKRSLWPKGRSSILREELWELLKEWVFSVVDGGGCQAKYKKPVKFEFQIQFWHRTYLY